MGEPRPAAAGRRRQIIDGIVDASLRLLATESPTEITLREIAEKAGVRHSDVHRYFGGKKELIKAAMTQAAERELAILRGQGDAAPGREELLQAWQGSMVGRVLLWAALEGVHPRDLLPGPLPSMAAGAAFAARRRRETEGDDAEGVDARVVVAVITAIEMSLQAAAPVILRAAGLDREDPAWLRERIAEVMTAVYLLAAPEPPSAKG